MILRGRSIYANSATAGKLTRYLLHNPKNERVAFLGCHGTAFPDDLEKSIDQMIWRAERAKSQKPLYFTALSPDLDVDKTLTEEEWEKMRYIQAKALGLEGQPYGWVEHQKYGDNGQLRIHRHVIYQRFDQEKECMISDEYDRRRNAQARAEIEETLGHERTFQRWTKVDIEKRRQLEIAEQFALNSAEIEKEQIDAVTRMHEIHEQQTQQPLGEDSLYDRMKRNIEKNKDKGWSY